MKLDQIIRILENAAPSSLTPQEPNKLLFGNRNIDKIGFSVYLTCPITNETIKQKLDLLVLHHLPTKDATKTERKNLNLLKRKGIAVLGLRLALDCAPNGLNNNLCKALGLVGKPLGKGLAYKARGNFTLKQLISKVRKIRPPTIRIAGPVKTRYKKVLVVAGSGFFPSFIENFKPDGYISGFLNRKSVQHAGAYGCTLIEASSYSTHFAGLEGFVKFIKPKLKCKAILLEEKEAIRIAHGQRQIK